MLLREDMVLLSNPQYEATVQWLGRPHMCFQLMPSVGPGSRTHPQQCFCRVIGQAEQSVARKGCVMVCTWLGEAILLQEQCGVCRAWRYPCIRTCSRMCARSPLTRGALHSGTLQASVHVLFILLSDERSYADILVARAAAGGWIW